jgi:TctA family transporter
VNPPQENRTLKRTWQDVVLIALGIAGWVFFAAAPTTGSVRDGLPALVAGLFMVAVAVVVQRQKQV